MIIILYMLYYVVIIVIFWCMFISVNILLIHIWKDLSVFVIGWYIFLFEEAEPSRSPRGRNLSFRDVFFKNHVFSSPTAQFQPREHHTVIRLATAISVHNFSSKKASCSLSSSQISDILHKSLFSMVCREATAAGTVPRAPGRSTCIGHTRDELRSPSDGRVVIIWMPPLGPGKPQGRGCTPMGESVCP